jgi:hypothetical protein
LKRCTLADINDDEFQALDMGALEGKRPLRDDDFGHIRNYESRYAASFSF